MLVRRLARPLLASTFVLGGIDQIRNPGEKTPAAAGVVKFLSERTSAAVPDVATVVKLDGLAKVVAGIGLGLSRAPRLCATILTASLVPTTLAAHAFWKIEDPQERAQQKVEFFKNASMVGGVLLATVDTAGKPSVGWRARRAARNLAREVSHVAESTTDSAERVARRTRQALPV